MAFPQPPVIVTAQGAAVVLELDQVQAAPAEHEQVDLVPLAVPVAALEVRPGAERHVVGQHCLDPVESLGLMGEGRGRDLKPALGVLRHDALPPASGVDDL